MTLMTAHARKRCQQRGIRDAVVDLLFEHGHVHYTRGGKILYFSKRTIWKLSRSGDDSRARMVQEHRDCYLVLCGATILTVGHRYKRLRTKKTIRRPRYYLH